MTNLTRVLIISVLFFICANLQAREFGKVFEATSDQQLDKWTRKASEEEIIILLKFDMVNCKYCEEMEPVIKKVAEDNLDILVVTVKSEKCPVIVQKLNVTRYPSYYLPHTRRMWSGVSTQRAIEREIRQPATSFFKGFRR